MIAIVDYGSGNIQAIKNIYKRLNVPCELVSDPERLYDSEKIILPGVGAFDESVSLLNESGMRSALDKQVLENEVPVLGICVGMQIMASGSEEGELPGLGWFDAKVRRFDDALIPHKPKTPHMGWNSIKPTRVHPILNEVDPEKGFYFLHTYYFDCQEQKDVLSRTDYSFNFSSSVNKDKIFGFQFHPEKSHSNGVNLFRNFADL